MGSATPGPDAPVLEARGVSFSYRQRAGAAALEQLTLRVDRGEMVALLGPNGSGKSTLLRVLSGVARPSSGQALLQDVDCAALPAAERARRLAFVPQRVQVELPFTAREVVMMGRAPHQGRLGIERARDAEVVLDAMRAMRVERLGDRRLGELSGGEAQRVMLAQALAQEPEVLLLDEPTSHLDIGFQVEIMELLFALHRDRTLTVLVSMHDLNLAGLFFRRLVVMRAGRVMADGAPAEVLTAELLREVYGADIHVGHHPDVEAPLLAVRRRESAALQKEDAPRGGTNP